MTSSMSPLRLVVLVVLGAACCTAGGNDELSSLTRTVEQLREEMQRSLRAAVNEMKETVHEACGSAAFAPDTQPAAPPPLPFSGTSDITQKLQSIENDVSEVKRKLDSLSDQQGCCEDVASSTELSSLTATITKQLDTTLRVFNSQVEELPSKTEVEAVVRRQTEEVKGAVRGVQEACGSDEKLDDLVKTVKEVQGHVEETKEAAQDTRNKVDQLVKQDVIGEVQGLGGKVDAVDLKIESLKDDLEAQIRFIGGRVEELTNTTQDFVTTVAEGIEKEGADKAPVYPCLDSEFVGTTAGKLCEIAVRKQRCLRPLLSYHCCRSCTDAGQIPESGAWRHLNLPRRVTPVEVFQGFLN